MKEIYSENKKVFWFLGFLAVLLVTIFVALFVLSLNNSDKSISIPGDWETYEKDGVKFGYPKNFTVQSEISSSGSIIVANKQEFPADAQSSEDFLMIQFGQITDADFSATTIKFLNNNDCEGLAREGVADEAVADKQAENTSSFKLNKETVCVIENDIEANESTPKLNSSIYLTKNKVNDSEIIWVFQTVSGEKVSEEDINNAKKVIRTFKINNDFKPFDSSALYSDEDSSDDSFDSESNSEVESESNNSEENINMETPTTVGRNPVLSGDEIKGKISVLTTDKGVIEIELFEDAPIAASNHIGLVKEGFYNGLTFHRREEGFVIQGGDPSGNGTGGPGYKFQDEEVTREYDRGIVAMANSGPNTNGSQFFIMLSDYPLPPSYTIFGKVISGMDVVDQIQVGDKIQKAEIK